MESKYGDNYKIYWLDYPRSDTSGPAQIGEVRNFDRSGLDYRSIPIICDNDLIEQQRMRFIVANWKEDGPRIILHSSLMQLPQEIIDVAIWHEVGHIHCEHPLKTRTSSQDKLIKERIDFVRRGKVVPDETEADAFAVKMVREGPVLRYLLLCYKARFKEKGVDIEDCGLQELKMRMRKISEYINNG